MESLSLKKSSFFIVGAQGTSCLSRNFHNFSSSTKHIAAYKYKQSPPSSFYHPYLKSTFLKKN